jgi:hypothetical protein
LEVAVSTVSLLSSSTGTPIGKVGTSDSSISIGGDSVSTLLVSDWKPELSVLYELLELELELAWIRNISAKEGSGVSVTRVFKPGEAVL